MKAEKKMIQTNHRMSQSMDRWLEKESEKRELSKSAFLRMIITEKQAELREDRRK